jgi:hypothetical protein
VSEIAVGYEILVEVKIDEETGEIRAVIAFPEDFTTVQPIHVYSDDDDYLDKSDPRYERAVRFADQVVCRVGDLHVPYTIREAA